MEKPLLIALIAVLLVLTRCASPETVAETRAKVIPRPALLQFGAGSFQVTEGTVILHEPGHSAAARIARDLADRLDRATGFRLIVAPLSGMRHDRSIILALNADAGALGGECNMWTERAPQEKVDGKVYPRLLAMCEVLWSDRTGRDYAEFHRRVQHHYERLDHLGVEYGSAARPVVIVPSCNRETRSFEIVLESGEQDVTIRYTLDGTEPSADSLLYARPLTLHESAEIRARAFRDGAPYGQQARRRVKMHQAVGATVSLKAAYSSKYSGGGDQALVDGLTGSANFGDGLWQAFLHDDLEATIDLGAPRPIETITARFLQNSNSWIFLPTEVEYSLSRDGETFKSLAILSHDVAQKNPAALIKEFPASCGRKTARFVRVRARSVKVCPPWHPVAGQKAWLFVDEIIVE